MKSLNLADPAGRPGRRFSGAVRSPASARVGFPTAAGRRLRISGSDWTKRAGGEPVGWGPGACVVLAGPGLYHGPHPARASRDCCERRPCAHAVYGGADSDPGPVPGSRSGRERRPFML